ncbi:probable crossover junction endonuclease EME2 [Vulpes vulpes]|uniref:Probable crossover junction endonuclease EME2 n=1 Tax=Vulpes vulpes TaxID=9627 RepID=A0ABM5A5X5_VULVU
MARAGAGGGGARAGRGAAADLGDLGLGRRGPRGAAGGAEGGGAAGAGPAARGGARGPRFAARPTPCPGPILRAPPASTWLSSGLDAYLRSHQPSSREVRQPEGPAVACAPVAPLSWPKVEELWAHLDVLLVPSWGELSQHVCAFTKAFAQRPFNTRSPAPFPSAGMGARQQARSGKRWHRPAWVWWQQIKQFNRVSLAVTDAVVAAFPSPRLLQQGHGARAALIPQAGSLGRGWTRDGKKAQSTVLGWNAGSSKARAHSPLPRSSPFPLGQDPGSQTGALEAHVVGPCSQAPGVSCRPPAIGQHQSRREEGGVQPSDVLGVTRPPTQPRIPGPLGDRQATNVCQGLRPGPPTPPTSSSDELARQGQP